MTIDRRCMCVRECVPRVPTAKNRKGDNERNATDQRQQAAEGIKARANNLNFYRTTKAGATVVSTPGRGREGRDGRKAVQSDRDRK